MPKVPFPHFRRDGGVVRDLNHAMSLGLPVLGAIRTHEAGDRELGETSREAIEAYQRLVDLVRGPDFHVRGRAIAVTSAESAGKSSVALDLATQLAQSGSKVVLVEADLRQATRRKVGDGSFSSGLAGMLVNQLRTASSAVVHTLEPKLKVLPAGSAAGTPASLLRSPRLPLVVDQLRALADQVIFDLPSVLAWEEILHLVRLTDMTLLVVENGKTGRGAATEAASRLKEANQGTLGVVLTRAPAWLATPRPPEESVAPAAVAAVATPAAPEVAPRREYARLAVEELMAELEEALKLVRPLQQPVSDTDVPKRSRTRRSGR